MSLNVTINCDCGANPISLQVEPLIRGVRFKCNNCGEECYKSGERNTRSKERVNK